MSTRVTTLLLVLCCLQNFLQGSDIIDTLRGNVRVEWKKELPLPYLNMNQFTAVDDKSGLYLISKYYARYGVWVDRFGNDGSILNSYHQLATDTQGYIPNAFQMARINDSTLRFYGSECWYYSIPPLHLSKGAWDFRPMFIDMDENLKPRSSKVFGSDQDKSFAFPAFSSQLQDSEIAAVSTHQDSIWLNIYEKDLSKKKTSFLTVLDSGSIFGSSPPVKTGEGIYVIGIYTLVDFGSDHFYVYEFNERTKGIRRIEFTDPFRNAIYPAHGDTVLSIGVERNDSTTARHLYLSTMSNQIIVDKTILPQFSVNPSVIKRTSDRGYILAGSARFAHANLNVDSTREAVVCKLDKDFNVEWYHILGSSSSSDQYVEVTERSDGSYWAFGITSDAKNNWRMMMTKYVPQYSSSVFDLHTSGQCCIYPNPASEKVNIRWLSMHETPTTITLTDMHGNQVSVVSVEGVPGQNTLNFDTYSLANGVYEIFVRSGQKIYTGILTVIR